MLSLWGDLQLTGRCGVMVEKVEQTRPRPSLRELWDICPGGNIRNIRVLCVILMIFCSVNDSSSRMLSKVYLICEIVEGML